MESQKLDPSFWEKKYQDQNTPWDIGYVSPAIKAYIDSISDKSKAILIPGSGKAHEAVYLHQQGFTNVFVCDWAPSAFEHLKKRAPDFPPDHLLVADFFELDFQVDLIIEQTFFCAINPNLRTQYVQKAQNLLLPSGELAGLLFAQPFPFEGPPFGGTKEEYLALFSPHFNIIEMEIASHSIKPRAGNEFFIRLKVA